MNSLRLYTHVYADPNLRVTFKEGEKDLLFNSDQTYMYDLEKRAITMFRLEQGIKESKNQNA